MGIKILKGGTNQPGTKPMSEMEPLEVAEVVSSNYPEDVGAIVLRTASSSEFEAMELYPRPGMGQCWKGGDEHRVEVRPLTEPITIEITND
jgi:hypothetical protein